MLRWLKKSEFAIDKEESGSHPIENPWFQYMYHFISLYLCLQRLAQKIVGTWNFPTSLTIPPMIAFTRLVLFAHSVLAGFGAPAAVLNKKGATLPRKVPRPIAILLTTRLFVAFGPFLWLPMEKTFICRRVASTLLANKCLHSTFSCCKSCMKQFPSTSEEDEWRWITGWKSCKMVLGKRQLTLSSWRDRCFTRCLLFLILLYLFIRPWMRWFDHFFD